MSKKGYIYIITNYQNTTLYIGVTSNLYKRIWEHKNKVVEGFSKKYNLKKLVYYEIADDIETAINREKYLKGKSRQYKINLIESINKEWKDLYDEITDSSGLRPSE
ncbi:GIY-YIG nuclease family protein [bacterium]|nr:GIY-YIG nuclease family protein [bacterium]